MTWCKLGDEWPDAARDLSDAAYRTHTEALCWSARRLLDLIITKRDIPRFAETGDPESAVAELVRTGWWQEIPEGYYIGVRFAEWQLESTVVQARRDSNAIRQRRHRLHKAGDHSLCQNCDESRRYETRDPGRVGTERDGTGVDTGTSDSEGEAWPDSRTRAEKLRDLGEAS